MKLVLLQIIFVLTFCTCTEVYKSKEPPLVNNTVVKCSEEERKMMLLKSIVGLPKLQPYIHPSEQGHEQIVVLNHAYFDLVELDSTLSKQVLLAQASEYQRYSDVDYERLIKFEKLEEEGDTIFVEFRYESEGVICFTSFRKLDCNWIEIKTDIAEE